MADSAFLPLEEDWEPTRSTLHAYAAGLGIIPRTHAIAHPRWWHISLKVRPNGLVTDTMSTPDGGTFHLRLDPRVHAAVVDTSRGQSFSVPMDEGATGTEFGDRLISIVEGLGLEGEYAREKFESDDARDYDAAAARRFFDVISHVDYVMERHRATLEGDVGPLQIWPHGFDLAFEWFGTRTETYEGEELPAQLNLGWYPGGRAYFYSNPWPFESEKLLGHELPHDAEWHTEGWEGTIYYHDQLVGDPRGPQKLLDYAKAVNELAAPTLMA